MSIDKFLGKLAVNGGIATSSNFVVRFHNPPITPPGGELDGIGYFEMFCNEAQLPNTNSGQGQMNGLYVGSGSVNYPHSRVFTDLQLGFICDANMSSLKFVQDWLDYIFGETGADYQYKTLGEHHTLAGSTRSENRDIRLKYRDDYARTITISKTEPGSESATERVPISYVLEYAYPYAVDAIPLSFGSSQLVQCTASFSYMRHYTIKSNITSKRGKALPVENKVITGGTGGSILAPGPAGDF